MGVWCALGPCYLLRLTFNRPPQGLGAIPYAQIPALLFLASLVYLAVTVWRLPRLRNPWVFLAR